ncbi:hypothetical protein ASE85_06830 [Sphingobium sp. Leaf26]|uniref:hypothetical protein n=1 Tax=Sphingobium sp. Leaf26 TaxID=1735693 RepID=UPI0006F8E220|nr:hypothetical protein [Sphingobium sp. Leaf26]KQN04708.1 hypothetical protein ASE85_06830 [Sphingobium sp. Leaf26]
MTRAISIRREAAISVVINGLLSFAFFLAVFGVQPRRIGWVAPDNLALDFIPQSIAVALMSALVPALIARRRLGHAPTLGPVLTRAALFALAGAVLGGALAFSIGSVSFPSIAWGAALTIKIAYGGALGALVATLALRRLLSTAR